ncbi:MAG TPA: hypothetical protein VKR32_02695 [Puia sp.]|nr:hypothetical protein [Puia sp.]
MKPAFHHLTIIVMTSDQIAVIANVALALSFIVGLIFGIAQVRTASRDRRERLTLEALREFQSREFAELMAYVSISNLPPTREEFMEMPTSERARFMQYAQEMESLGIMVAEGLIGMDLVDKTLGSFVTTTWDKYKTLFSDLRRKQPDPFLGEYFQWLAERIEERMRLSPRKPFHESHSGFMPK